MHTKRKLGPVQIGVLTPVPICRGVRSGNWGRGDCGALAVVVTLNVASVEFYLIGPGGTYSRGAWRGRFTGPHTRGSDDLKSRERGKPIAAPSDMKRRSPLASVASSSPTIGLKTSGHSRQCRVRKATIPLAPTFLDRIILGHEAR